MVRPAVNPYPSLGKERKRKDNGRTKPIVATAERGVVLPDSIVDTGAVSPDPPGASRESARRWFIRGSENLVYIQNHLATCCEPLCLYRC